MVLYRREGFRSVCCLDHFRYAKARLAQRNASTIFRITEESSTMRARYFPFLNDPLEARPLDLRPIRLAIAFYRQGWGALQGEAFARPDGYVRVTTHCV